ncbi:MAG: TetR family transcriptional regulator [Myxococcales bacterium]|nr:TetR family transcriptional regulator [Myxococcales bacterium]
MAANRTARQIRADDTRARLFAAATELFATRGYHEASVDAIVKRAGVAKGTFFVHFATKDAVIVDLVRMQTRAAKRARTAAVPQGPVAALRAAVLALGEQAGLSRELSRAVLEATLENADVSGDADQMFGEILADMTADARAAIEAGVLHASRDPVLIARALMASYLGAALHFCSSRKSGPLLEILAPLVDANIQGFMNPEASHDPSPRTRTPGRRRRRLLD